MKNKPRSHAHEKPRPEQAKSDEVKVHGSVQVFHTEETIKQEEADRKDAKTYNKHTHWYEERSVLIATIVAALTALP
jgi:hypothetical protein